MQDLIWWLLECHSMKHAMFHPRSHCDACTDTYGDGRQQSIQVLIRWLNSWARRISTSRVFILTSNSISEDVSWPNTWTVCYDTQILDVWRIHRFTSEKNISQVLIGSTLNCIFREISMSSLRKWHLTSTLCKRMFYTGCVKDHITQPV